MRDFVAFFVPGSGTPMRSSSFRRLALGHLDLLYATARRVTGSREQAEDLVQETYRLAFQHWRSLRDPAACRAWLLRILRNAHVDQLRAGRRLVSLEGHAVDLPDPRTLADPARSALASLDLERLQEALAGLPEESRWLFWLREMQGLSYAELAEVFDVPVGTIRSRLARLRARLVARLAERGSAANRLVKGSGGSDG